jgi:hypothetical protein
VEEVEEELEEVEEELEEVEEDSFAAEEVEEVSDAFSEIGSLLLVEELAVRLHPTMERAIKGRMSRLIFFINIIPFRYEHADYKKGKTSKSTA